MKREGFFKFDDISNDIAADNITTENLQSDCSTVQSTNADNEIGLIMTLAVSLLGVFLMVQGFLRDYVSFGVCRLVTYISLCIVYLLLAIAEPGYSDSLQERFHF